MKRIVHGASVVRWVAQRTSELGDFGCAVGIGVEEDGQLIGGVAYNEFNGVNVNMHTAALSGSGWLTRRALHYFFHYPFEVAQVKRVTALVGEGNAKSRKLVEGVGFELEASLKSAHPTGDLLVYRMTREMCRWIRKD